MVPSPNFQLPPELQDMLRRQDLPVIQDFDTWECPQGHSVKVPVGTEPRLAFGGVPSPKAMCLMCFMAWLSEQFPLEKKSTKLIVEP